MPGLALIIDRAGSGPVLDTDAILTAGSLLLIDPSHGLSSWADGVPSAAAYLPNLASDQAHALVGKTSGGDEKEVRTRLLRGPNENVAYKFERTPKGGLHGVVSQANHVNGQGARLEVPQAILDYILANPTHRFYASLWSDETRVGGNPSASSQAYVSAIGSSGSTAASVYVYSMRTDITRPNATTTPPPTGLLPATAAGSDVLGLRRRNIATGGFVGAVPSALVGSLMQWGSFGVVPSASSPVAQMPSHVFYRYYLEDLTVSGRTYGQVDAIDAQLYAAKVTTVGGAYNGDAPTSPAVLIA